MLSRKLTPESLFVLVPIDQSNSLKKDSYFMIKHCSSNAYFENDAQKKKASAQTEQDLQGNKKLLRIRKIADDEDRETKTL